MTRNDEQDRYGDMVHEAGPACINQWVDQRDRELLAELRRKANARAVAEQHLGTPRKLFSRIVCPIDFDANSLRAMDVARRLAEQNDAELYLLHACPSVFVPLSGNVSDRVMAERSAQRRLDEIAGQNLGGVRCHILVTTGDAAQWIQAVQQALDADLIVMSTHGRRAVARVLLGSVAEQVLREAACPVLTVRQEHCA